MTDEVDLTPEQAARALKMKKSTALAYARPDEDGNRKFPRAYLLHNSRKLGYRIPEGDILAYARSQGPSVIEQAQQIIAEVRTAQGRLTANTAG